MKPSLVIVTVAAVLMVAVAVSAGLLALPPSSAAKAKQQSGFLTLPPAAAAGQMTLYGHIKTLSRKGGHLELRFDPAWFTSGLTASRAALEDTGSSDVPNDNYVIDAGHRLLTYLVPVNARVTVITNNSNGLTSTSITVSELGRIVNGGKHRKLFEGLDSGIWLRVRSDTVLEVDQQYHP